MPQDRKEMNRVKRHTPGQVMVVMINNAHVNIQGLVEGLGSRWDGTSMIPEDAGKHGKDRKNIWEQKDIRKAQWQR